MGLDNDIEYAMKGILKNPILSVLKEIKIVSILKQSNFHKRNTGYSVFLVLLHLVYMLIMNKRQSSFVKQSSDAYGKDTYYRFIQSKRYNWRKLLLLSSQALIEKVVPLHKNRDPKILIIDDTVEIKRGKQIEGSCKSLWSNKEHHCVNGINIVSLNFTDTHSTFQLDFAISMNKSRRKEVDAFTQTLHHRSNAYKRRVETNKGKNTLAIEMLKRALDQGIVADYLLVDSWYAKPNFIKEVRDEGVDTIARIANNNMIWNFKGKHKTLNSMYDALSEVKNEKSGHYGKIRYNYFDSTVEHTALGRVKLVFLHTGKELIILISTDVSLGAKEIIATYKKRWNIEQGYKDLRAYFGLGKEENRIYEALIAKITLSMFAYNLVSYINRMQHEPQTLGELFRDLECELEALAISMQLFLQILTKISQIENIVKENKDILSIIALLGAYTQKELGFMCES
jgi:SRSO17 transposase